jgi:WD40 repeat protein
MTDPSRHARHKREKPAPPTLSPRVAFRTAFAPRRSLLAVAGQERDNIVNLWKMGSWSLFRQLPIADGVRSLVFSGDGGLLAAGSSDGSITIWDMKRRDLPHRRLAMGGPCFVPDGSAVLAVAVTPGRQLMAVTKDGLLGYWNLADRQTGPSRDSRPFPSGLIRAAFSPDGTLVVATVAGTQPDTAMIEVRDARTGTRAFTLDVEARDARGLSFSPDGSLFATYGGGRLVVWAVGSAMDGTMGTWTAVAEIDEPETLAVAFDRHDATIAIARPGQVTLHRRGMLMPADSVRALAAERLRDPTPAWAAVSPRRCP